MSRLTSSRVRALAMAGIAAALLFWSPRGTAQSHYTYAVVHNLGGSVNSQPPSINRFGHMAYIASNGVLYRAAEDAPTAVYAYGNGVPGPGGHASINADGTIVFRTSGLPFFPRIMKAEVGASATIFAEAGSTWDDVGNPSIDDAGNVVFNARFNATDAYHIVRGAAFTPVASPGDAVEGGTLVNAYAPKVSNSGAVGFTATVSAGPVSIFRAANGGVTRIGTASATGTGAPTYSMNEAGLVAYWTQQSSPTAQRILTSDGVTETTIAVSGPGFITQPHRVAINNAGLVAFQATNYSGGLPGVWVGNGTFVRSVLEPGDIVPGLGPVLQAVISHEAINDLGQIAMSIIYLNGSSWNYAIVRADPINSPPSAEDAAFEIDEDTPLGDTLPASDADANSLTYTIVQNGALGTATITDAATGAFTYVPQANVSGTDTFTFRVNDGTIDSSTATVTVTIAPVNDPPSAAGGLVTTMEDTPAAGVLAASDVEGDPLVYAIVSNGSRGTAVVTNPSTGAFTYTPNPNASGTDSFTYQVSDGGGVTSSAMVNVTIAPVDDPPVALTGLAGSNGGLPVHSYVGATDADGDTLTFSIVSQPTQGTVAITNPFSGAFTYTPQAGAIGYDAFTFSATSSPSGASSTGTFMVLHSALSPQWPGQTVRASVGSGGVQLSGVRGVPSADGRLVAFTLAGGSQLLVHDRQTLQTTRIDVASNGDAGSGGDNAAISAGGRYMAFDSTSTNLVAGDANGVGDVFVRDLQASLTERVSVATDGTEANGVSYAPAISGDGRYVAFVSRATNLVSGDTNGREDIFLRDRTAGRTTRLSVGPGGVEAPQGIVCSVDSDGQRPCVSIDLTGRYVAFASFASNLVAGDTNGSLDSFVHDVWTGLTTRVSVASGGGQVANGGFSPSLSPDGRFVVFVSDSSGLVPGDANAARDVFLHDRDTRQTRRVSLGEGDVEANGSSDLASVSLWGQYVAFWSTASNLVDGDANGARDVFVRDVVEGRTVRVNVASDGTLPNQHPRGVPRISVDGRFIVFFSDASNLVAGDTNAASDVFVVGGVSVAPTTHSVGAAGGAGSVDVSFAYPGTSWTATTGTSWMSVTGQSGTNGNGTVTFSASPNSGVVRTGTLTVALQKVTVEQAGNAPPVGAPDAATTAEDNAVSIDLTANDTDADGDGLLVVATTATQHGGSVDILTASTVRYTPPANFHGIDTFQYTVRDAPGAQGAPATVTVTVTPVNDAPEVIGPDTATTAEDTAVTIRPKDNDRDVDGDTFSIVSFTQPAHGTVTQPGTATLVYTPNPNFHGADAFTYTIGDGSGATASGPITVTVTPVDDPPVAVPGVGTLTAATVFAGTLAATDVEGDAVAFSLQSQASQGTVTIADAATGAFSYTPNAGASGYDSFTFGATPSGGGSGSSATFMLFITSAVPQWPGQTVRASVGAGGTQSSSGSGQHDIDAQGRRIVFVSDAPLVAGDTNNRQDVFVHDRAIGVTTRVSVSSGGVQANDSSFLPRISADGRVVVFSSSASNLVPGDSNGQPDVFAHDLTTGQTTKVSAGSGAAPQAAVSADGRFVAFESLAANQVPGDTNAVRDIFVHDRLSGQTTRVSVASGGAEANGASFAPSVSADGRHVAFWSQATNLVAGDTNARDDVFVHDRMTGTTSLISRGVGGAPGDRESRRPQLSPDGRLVAFHSAATNLVAGDTNNNTDVFVHDRATGVTRRVSVASGGAQTNFGGAEASLSADGRYVAFKGFATNLVPGDTNETNDVFVHDVATSITTRVNLRTDGQQASEAVFNFLTPAISADGRFVAFDGLDAGYVAGDSNGFADVFVVGGVTVSPTAHSVGAGGGTRSVAVTFAYPGTAWAGTSNASWLNVTGQSSSTGSGTVTVSAASNPGAARTGTVIVALQTVTVAQAANTSPIGVADTATTAEDTPVSIDLTANDSDADGDALMVVVTTATARGGLVAILDSATVRYTPPANFHGEDSFQYTVRDANGAQAAPATVTVTVTPVNDAPEVIGPDTATTAEDMAVTIRPKDNDRDVDGDTFSIVAFTSPSHGTVTQPGTATLIYTPNPNFHGVDAFTYTISDGSGATASGPIAVTVTPVNDPPVAVGPDTATTSEDSAIEIRPADNDFDVDGPIGQFQITAVSQPAHGVVSQPGTHTLIYTPAADYHGGDSFTYTITDLGGATSVGVVAVTVTPVNDAPEAEDGAVLTSEDTASGGTLAAADIDGDALTFALVADGAKGTVSLEPSTGAFTYTPHADHNGTDTFTFRVSDSGGLVSDVAIVQVDIAAINDAPVAQSVATAAPKQSPIAGALVATDVDGDALTYVLVQGAAQGTAVVNADGTYSYVSATNASGTDQFTFRALDASQAASNVATVMVTILSNTGAPVADDGTLATDEDTPAGGTLRAIGQPGRALIYAVASPPSKGTLELNAATGAFTYTPNANISGEDSFRFRASDGSLNSNLATVTITVAPVNDGPVASLGTLTVQEDRAEAGILIGTDVDGQTLTYALVDVPLRGTVTITNAATGRYTYVPHLNATGTDRFTFTVSDGIVTSAPAAVNLVITPENDVPVAQDAAFSMTVGGVLSALMPAVDPDGDALVFEVTRNPRRGSLAFNASTGSFVYTPNPGFSGQDEFTFLVFDGTRRSQRATVTIAVVP